MSNVSSDRPLTVDLRRSLWHVTQYCLITALCVSAAAGAVARAAGLAAAVAGRTTGAVAGGWGDAFCADPVNVDATRPRHTRPTPNRTLFPLFIRLMQLVRKRYGLPSQILQRRAVVSPLNDNKLRT